jgi:integration host factor subunit alpha
MATVTKASLADKITTTSGLNGREAADVVQGFFEETSKALEEGKDVKLAGIGNFNLRDKNERPGRNPTTGEEVTITPRRVVTFHAGQKLKTKVKRHVGKELK